MAALIIAFTIHSSAYWRVDATTILNTAANGNGLLANEWSLSVATQHNLAGSRVSPDPAVHFP